MNPNTNAVPNTSTTTSGPGSGIGSRLRGAAEVVHGAGEGLRGTLLGAVDTVMKNGPTQNDEVARQGRLEVERGMAKMKGQNTAGTTAYGKATSTTSGNIGYGAPHTTSAATLTPAFEAGTTSGALHPNHHREDAVAGIPQDELRDVQSHAPQSCSQSQAPYGQHTNADGFGSTAATYGANTNNASAGYAPGTGGTYGPPGNGGQNLGEYPHQANETVTKNEEFDVANGGLAHDQGHGGRAMGMSGRDGRTGLN
ncbi:hypothetical protein D9619_003771 [Psilocybe cf. subviscida]|uniref:Uncharacterized protein n=1 Tax=Psilocybe cf. subviscida TaxID=2480587 RepID=A0A8H5ETX2_9AGAR|nr:hypothetical protein D9619_003771 [Psilocybe cf. subviscida]